jgi:hypothetical protein
MAFRLSWANWKIFFSMQLPCFRFAAHFYSFPFWWWLFRKEFSFLLATLCYDNLAQCVYKKVKHMFRNNLICIRRGYYVCKDSWGPCHSVLLCPFLTSKMKTVKIPHSAPQHNMHIVQDCFALWGQCLSKIDFNLCTLSIIYFCEFTIFFSLKIQFMGWGGPKTCLFKKIYRNYTNNSTWPFL